MSRILFNYIFPLFLIVIFSRFSVEEKQNKLPNIVLFFADDLGYGDLDVYGHPTSSTPNIGRLAAGGKLLTQFYSGAAVCSPSRAALLTGRYPMRSGVWPNVFNESASGGLPLNETTIAEMLQPLGYHTAMVGKWHLGIGKNSMYLPPHQGFQEFFGTPSSQSEGLCTICFYPDIPCHSAPCNPQLTDTPLYNGTTIIEQPLDLLTLDQKYSSRARTIIRTNAQAGKPFFLYYPSQHTHSPQYGGKEVTGTTERGMFGDSLAGLDDEVGQVMEELEAQGILENTFIFFSSDNGPSLLMKQYGGDAGPLRCGKGTTYEGGLRVPAIAHWPGRITPGRSLDLASSLDVLPTIAAVTGATLPKVVLDGYDMSPFLFQEKPSLRDTYYYYPPEANSKYKSFAIRHKQYKAVFYTEGSHLSDDTNRDMGCRSSATVTKHDPPMLFDLDVDPSENYNITGQSGYDDILAQLTKMRADFDAKMVWASSETNKPHHADYMPCCNPGCTPFPRCCHCSAKKTPLVDYGEAYNTVHEL